MTGNAGGNPGATGDAAGSADRRCGNGGHEVRTARLVLRSPTVLDLAAGNAAGSDPEAQRWLGFPKGAVVPEPRRSELLALPPGSGEVPDLAALFPDSTALVAIDGRSGGHVGVVAVEVHPSGGHHVGGWIAPAFRRSGLGAELFAAAALLAHDHLALPELRAVVENRNTAAVGALSAAGYEPVDGPGKHALLDGRVIRALWYAHTVPEGARCAV